MGAIKRKCDNCGKEYNADTRNLRRGWGRCCCKSCAAQLREKRKPGYNPKRVAINNVRRQCWTDCPVVKECYKNAHLLTLLFPDRVQYVEGKTNVFIPIYHAFNRVGNKYIDITFEFALG